jgi:hypothetical protein
MLLFKTTNNNPKKTIMWMKEKTYFNPYKKFLQKAGFVILQISEHSSSGSDIIGSEKRFDNSKLFQQIYQTLKLGFYRRVLL